MTESAIIHGYKVVYAFCSWYFGRILWYRIWHMVVFSNSFFWWNAFPISSRCRSFNWVYALTSCPWLDKQLAFKWAILRNCWALSLVMLTDLEWFPFIPRGPSSSAWVLSYRLTSVKLLFGMIVLCYLRIASVDYLSLFGDKVPNGFMKIIEKHATKWKNHIKWAICLTDDMK